MTRDDVINNRFGMFGRGEDSQIRMWDLKTRRCKVIFTGHSKAVTCLTKLKEDGSHLILSGSKVYVILYSTVLYCILYTV